ncbi:MAG: hypothetical protein AAB614_00915 [Patescibacteria group bacterium]
MDSNTTPAKEVVTPNNLPILDDKKIETHTMQQDLQHPNLKKSSSSSDVFDVATPSEKTKIPEPPKPPTFTSDLGIKKPSPFDRFKKPQDLEKEGVDMSKLREMIPKTSDQSNMIKQPSMEVTNSTLPPMPSEIKPTDVRKLAIDIPGEKSKASLIIALALIIILVAGGAGFGYYWFFIKTTVPLEITMEEEKENPEVVIIPEPITQEPIINTEEVIPPIIIIIPEPATPQTDLIFKQTMITTSNQKDQIELIKSLKADAKSIAGDGTITRHLFKISNDTEKRFIINRELLNMFEISIPETILAYIGNIEFVSYKIDNSIRYGIIANIQNKDAVMTALKNWNIDAIKELKTLFMSEPITIPESPKFSENIYLNFSKIYINLTSTDISLDFGISDKYLIIATSKDMIFGSILHTQQ